jgi:regulator of protease activity HflC (stomatin/prohibitin superfamily)
MVLLSGLKVLNEYERAVVFRLGRLNPFRGPGIIFVIPILERAVRIDLRTVTLDIPAQDVITRDNVTVKVSAVLYFRVIDPSRAVTEVRDYLYGTMQLAQTTLRSVGGQTELDYLLSQREKLNARIQDVIDAQTEPWGIKVVLVELKNIDLPQDMQRAIAAQAEAERERRAKVIAAEGEFQAAQRLAEAAEIMGKSPITLQFAGSTTGGRLRYPAVCIKVSSCLALGTACDLRALVGFILVVRLGDVLCKEERRNRVCAPHT